MKKVLCVGLVCLDVIQCCKGYPVEDSDQRSLSCIWQRGGNASNNCTVLSLLGANAEFIGTIADGILWQGFVKEDFISQGIDTNKCAIYGKSYEFPFSTVLINSQNGSRTIIHSNKNLPELLLSDFLKLNLEEYAWIHFEGRNVNEISKMIDVINIYNNKNLEEKITVSLELEKPKNDVLSLAQKVDVVFVGKDFALFNQWHDMTTCLKSMKPHLKSGATCVCAWGDKGAMVLKSDSTTVFAPSFPPEKVVDTLAAGDTFCAASIHCLVQGMSVEEAITFACQAAGAKVSSMGFTGLKSFLNLNKRRNLTMNS